MRFAIYFAPPPGTRLHHLGASWLGYDAFSRNPILKKSSLGAVVDEPARYGFHATLKAPFLLNEDSTAAALFDAFDEFALQQPVVSSGVLELKDIDRFLALVPAQQSASLCTLANDCVTRFDTFRRAPDAAELERRRRAKLTAQQEKYLEAWGYPYVFGEFRFHMTLTRRLSADEMQSVLPAAQKHFAEFIGRELIIDHLCIFREINAQHPFTVERSANLGEGNSETL